MKTANLCYANHSNYAIIEDIVSYLRVAFVEAGYFFKIMPTVDKLAHNIFLECFADEFANSLVTIVGDGVRVSIVATEAITGQTFNDFCFRNRNNGWYGNHEAWLNRYQNFMKVAAACKSVWCFTQQQMDAYATVMPKEWLRLLPIGYVDGYQTIDEHHAAHKDIDFVFTGHITERRKAILTALQAKGTSVMTLPATTPTFIRSSIVGRAKICLGLKHFDEWQYPSLMRSYYHLTNRSFMISEVCELSSVLDTYVTLAQPDDLLELCASMLERDDLPLIAQHYLDRFKEEKPLRPAFKEFVKSID